MATIGRARAVAMVGRLHFSGYLAWLAWLFIHLIELIGFQNRLLVLLQWAWSYFTFNRGARLITGVKEGRREITTEPRKAPESNENGGSHAE